MAAAFIAVVLTSTVRRIPLARSPAGEGATSVYSTKIQPVFNARCIACHSCYNSPCQLNLSAYEGFDRGATKGLVYQSNRLKKVPTTRLFEDAHSAADWHSRLGFFPVQPQMSLLLEQKAKNPLAGGTFIPEDSHSCPKDAGEVAHYLAGKPEGGMPFGFPALSPSEFGSLTDWLHSGAPGPTAAEQAHLTTPSNGAEGLAVLKKWEDFFNGPDIKMRISARYIYEHLFLAHINFEELPEDFYRFVRSRTAYPAPIDEIATRRPYDDPQSAQFYYRFKKISATLVRKTHIPYVLSDAKMNRFRKLFLETRWQNPNPQFPSYERETGANPFVSFVDIPAWARSHFMLDDAYYHVMSFIRGPVCKGNVALNVINTQFYIMFMNPETDLTVTHPEFLPSVAKHLKMPAVGGESAKALYPLIKFDQMAYERAKKKLYTKFGAAGLSMDDIWSGEGTNDNAILTVFRHFDSADVLKGAWGGDPKTAWVLDYPTFERIYYDLVAGFDVYGNVTHQISTRMYMDVLRISAEDQFLSFLPRDQRMKYRKYWYRGAWSRTVLDVLDPLYEKKIETRVTYRNPGNAKEEFFDQVLNQRLNSRVRGPIDNINHHAAAQEAVSPDIHTVADLERELRKITRMPEKYARAFPEVSFIRVRNPLGDDLVYTLIHNKEHLNVKFLFLEEHYLDPDNDDLAIVPGFQGSYPNFFFDVRLDRAGEFLATLQGLDPDSESGDSSYDAFVLKYGVRRLDPHFWEEFDWFNERYQHDEPQQAGVFDLNRYDNQ